MAGSTGRRGAARAKWLTDPDGTESSGSDRRQEILDAAQALFAKRGFQGTSMRDIADAVGILGGSLYHHFQSKEAMYLEIHGGALDRAAAVLRRAISRHKD